MKRLFLGVALAAVAVWAGFVARVYGKMASPPQQFTAFVAQLPQPAMMLFPFQTMWAKARAGYLQPGDMAPDFDLETADRNARVRLSSHRGVRPVVLVFGSYT